MMDLSDTFRVNARDALTENAWSDDFCHVFDKCQIPFSKISMEMWSLTNQYVSTVQWCTIKQWHHLQHLMGSLKST